MTSIGPAVFPTVFVGGPIAILAMLFPPVFGGLLLVARRWKAALAVVSLNSTLYLLYSWNWSYELVRGTWWGTPEALWIGMTLVTLLGLAAARWRMRSVLSQGAADKPTPTRLERACILIFATLALLGLLYAILDGQSLFAFPWRGLIVLGCACWAAVLWMLWSHRMDRASRVPFSGEGICLASMLIAALGLAIGLRTFSTSPVRLGNEEGTTVGSAAMVWQFEPRMNGTIVASPLVTDDRVFLAVAVDDAVRGPYGVVYCLDARTGKPIWAFNEANKDGMKAAFSSPCLAQGRVYLGEGFHEDQGCRLYCLRASDGHLLWSKLTGSHTESSPCVSEGRVYFGAGDDGLYCLDALTGEERWHYQNQVHIDADPLVVHGRVFGGGGVLGPSVYKRMGIYCLDAVTGTSIWWKDTPLPVMGTPSMQADQVFFAVGNGNFSQSSPEPEGGIICIEASSGRRLWEFKTADAVVARPIVTQERVYLVSRDGACYAVGREDHGLRWKRPLGSPIVASPALMQNAQGGILVVAPSAGPLCGLDLDTGQIRWTFELAERERARPFLQATPALQPGTASKRQIFLAAGLNTGVSLLPVLYCLEAESSSF